MGGFSWGILILKEGGFIHLFLKVEGFD